MRLGLRYFARLRESFERDTESLDVPEGWTVGHLLAHLRARGGAWARELDAELGASRAFRVAVNQDIATPEQALADGDEVAIFPPVTGG